MGKKFAVKRKLNYVPCPHFAERRNFPVMTDSLVGRKEVVQQLHTCPRRPPVVQIPVKPTALFVHYSATTQRRWETKLVQSPPMPYFSKSPQTGFRNSAQSLAYSMTLATSNSSCFMTHYMRCKCQLTTGIYKFGSE